VPQVIALAVANGGRAARAARARQEEHVDEVLAPAVGQHGDRPSIQIIEPATDERKPLRGEVMYRGRVVELAVEPWLHRVLIRRDNIGKVAGH